MDGLMTRRKSEGGREIKGEWKGDTNQMKRAQVPPLFFLLWLAALNFILSVQQRGKKKT
jgi:hypothetical protein